MTQCGRKVVTSCGLWQESNDLHVWREINNPVYWESNDAVWKESNDIVWAVAGKK